MTLHNFKLNLAVPTLYDDLTHLSMNQHMYIAPQCNLGSNILIPPHAKTIPFRSVLHQSTVESSAANKIQDSIVTMDNSLSVKNMSIKEIVQTDISAVQTLINRMYVQFEAINNSYKPQPYISLQPQYQMSGFARSHDGHKF